jgi:undecaprenyl-diphosphatase
MNKIPTANDTLVPEATHRKSIIKKRNTRFFIVIFVTILAFGALTTFVKLNPPFFPIDLQITLALQSFNPMWFDMLMRTITFMGNMIPGAISLAVAALILIFFKKKYEAGMLVFSATALTFIGILFKQFVGRVRPDGTIINQVATFTANDSFPSGHVLFYISFYGFLLYLCLVLVKKGTLKFIYVGILISLLVLIGLSRIYLGAHWFSDVMGAYLLGFLWLTFLSYIYKRRKSL